MNVQYKTIEELINMDFADNLLNEYKDYIPKKKSLFLLGDIIFITKNDKVINVFCTDKIFKDTFMKLVCDKEGNYKRVFTLSYRCYIISIAQIEEKLTYEEFCIRMEEKNV